MPPYLGWDSTGDDAGTSNSRQNSNEPSNQPHQDQTSPQPSSSSRRAYDEYGHRNEDRRATEEYFRTPSLRLVDGPTVDGPTTRTAYRLCTAVPGRNARASILALVSCIVRRVHVWAANAMPEPLTTALIGPRQHVLAGWTKTRFLILRTLRPAVVVVGALSSSKRGSRGS